MRIQAQSDSEVKGGMAGSGPCIPFCVGRTPPRRDQLDGRVAFDQKEDDV